MKLIHHIEIEYDFALHFDQAGKFKVGDSIESGIIDDAGTLHEFAGVAIVVAMDQNWSSQQSASEKIYVRIYRPVD